MVETLSTDAPPPTCARTSPAAALRPRAQNSTSFWRETRPMSRVFSVFAGPRAKWVVFFLWLAVMFGSLAANLPGKFSDAENNESTSFLPGDAESTKALEITERLNEGDVAPTVVVYRRDGGLTEADRAKIASDTSELNRITRQYENTTPFGRPTFSRDGTSALVQDRKSAV